MDDQVVGPDLILSTSQEGDAVAVAVKGELDAYTAPGLEEQVKRLLEDGQRHVVLHLADTGFLDSSGLRAILTAQRRINEAGGELELRAPSEAVSRLLEITGLTSHFRFS